MHEFTAIPPRMIAEQRVAYEQPGLGTGSGSVPAVNCLLKDWIVPNTVGTVLSTSICGATTISDDDPGAHRARVGDDAINDRLNTATPALFGRYAEAVDVSGTDWGACRHAGKTAEATRKAAKVPGLLGSVVVADCSDKPVALLRHDGLMPQRQALADRVDIGAQRHIP